MPTVNPLSKRKVAIDTRERPRQRGPEAIVELANQWQMEPVLVSGELVWYRSDGAVPDGGRKLLEDATRLVEAHLLNDRLRCGWPHRGEPPVALTLTFPRLLPICEAHLDGFDPDHAA